MNRPGPAVGSRLILGGHTFISQLGNDPAASREEQQGIVRACLDAGVCWFDTTYQPERRALGETLQALRDYGIKTSGAKVIAWNFFNDFDSNGALGDRKSTSLNFSHRIRYRMASSA